MNFKQQFSKILFYNVFAALLLVVAIASQTTARAQGSVSIYPNVADVTINAGKERTFALTTAYKVDKPEFVSQMKNARIVARISDWTVEPDGTVRTAAPGTLERSAAPWVIFSPSEFALAPGAAQMLRFTVSVPQDAKPGDYYFGVYIEDRDPPPPPKEGERKMNARFRIYSLIYIRVPGLTQDGELVGLKAEMVDGVPVVTSTLKNKGNSFFKPSQSIVITDQADKTVAESPMQVTRSVLGNKEMAIKTALAGELAAGTYNVVYKVDVGSSKPVFVGRAKLIVTETDALLAKQRSQKAPQNQTAQTAPPAAAPENTAKPQTQVAATTAPAPGVVQTEAAAAPKTAATQTKNAAAPPTKNQP